MDTITANVRGVTGKAKQLRRSGIIPCVIYGTGLEESLHVQIDLPTARQILRTKRNGSMVDIQVDGKNYHTLIKDLEYNNLTDEVVHISFNLLQTGKKVNSVADIVLLNKDKAQGVLEQIQMTVPHAAEPDYLLDTVTVDIVDFPVGTVLTIGDIPEFQNDKIEIQADPSSIVLRISERKRAAETPSQEEQ